MEIHQSSCESTLFINLVKDIKNNKIQYNPIYLIILTYAKVLNKKS